METTLILNDGTEIQKAHMLESGGELWIYVNSGMKIRELFDLLRDPEKVRVIRVKETGTRYRGYREIFSIREEQDGQVYAGLRKI